MSTSHWKTMVGNNKILNNQKGQAVFELIIFIPFLVFLYSIYYTIGNSISGSINQQKAVRGYYYALVRGNSYINTFSDLIEFNAGSIKKIGFNAIGWREKSDGAGTLAFAPCFKFSSVLKSESTEECDDKTREDDGKTRLIRVFTFYGVCGPVYTANDNGSYFDINPADQSNPYNCALSN